MFGIEDLESKAFSSNDKNDSRNDFQECFFLQFLEPLQKPILNVENIDKFLDCIRFPWY